jgi:hypothetical protein
MEGMRLGQLDLMDVRCYIEDKYLQNKKEENRISVFGSCKSKKIRVVSRRKYSNFSNKTNEPR